MHRVKNEGLALDYLTDCTIATVGYMAGLKSKSKSEYNRQISIAQKGVDFIIQFGCDIREGSRVSTVIESYNGNVAEYAKRFDV